MCCTCLTRGSHPFRPPFTCALGPDATFYFCGGGEHPVLYRVHKGHDQLVLPSGGGFCDTVLRELYDTALGGHLGSAKTLEGTTSMCLVATHVC